MRILRVVATIVTGTVMLAGGAVLTLTGPPLVIALGVATAVVGVFHTYAGLAAEHVPVQTADEPGEPVAVEVEHGHAGPDQTVAMPGGLGVLSTDGSNHAT